MYIQLSVKTYSFDPRITLTFVQNSPVDDANHKRQCHGRIVKRPVDFERRRHIGVGLQVVCKIPHCTHYFTTPLAISIHLPANLGTKNPIETSMAPRTPVIMHPRMPQSVRKTKYIPKSYQLSMYDMDTATQVI